MKLKEKQRKVVQKDPMNIRKMMNRPITRKIIVGGVAMIFTLTSYMAIGCCASK